MTDMLCCFAAIHIRHKFAVEAGSSGCGAGDSVDILPGGHIVCRALHAAIPLQGQTQDQENSAHSHHCKLRTGPDPQLCTAPSLSHSG